MTKSEIVAIGNFLNYYRTDLIYINNFQKFKNKALLENEYLKKVSGSFYSFTIEFRIVRNFPKRTANRILAETNSWIKTVESDNVDLFAEKLKDSGLTRDGTMVSLASKILFLNNPWRIIPMDQLARNTLNQTKNNYELYTKNLVKFKEDNEFRINEMLNFVEPLLKIIHEEFKELNQLDLIAKNRMTDKLLWTLGSK